MVILVDNAVKETEDPPFFSIFFQVVAFHPLENLVVIFAFVCLPA